MITRRRLLGGLVLAAMWRGDGAIAESLEPLEVDWQQVFSLTWEVSARRGRPVVIGKIRNVSFWGTSQIQLLVEQLDGGGRTVTQQLAWLGVNLNVGEHGFFDVPVADGGAAYRVRVFAFTRKFGSSQC